MYEPALTANSMYFSTGGRFLRMRRIPPWVDAILWRVGVARSMVVGVLFVQLLGGYCAMVSQVMMCRFRWLCCYLCSCLLVFVSKVPRRTLVQISVGTT